jgi:O-antigen/teichoic acid export membrane protein
VGICAAIALARGAALVTGAKLMRATGLLEIWRWDGAAALALGRRLAPFAALLTLSMLYFRVDVLMVGGLLGAASTGLYGAALALYSIVLLLPESILSAVYPRLASAARASREGYADATLLSVRVLAAGIVPLALLIMSFADQILGVAYGARFRPSAETLRILAASLPLHAINGALGQSLQAGGLQGSMLRVIALGVVSHMAMTAALLPLVGIEGAAISLFLSSAVVSLGAALSFHRHVTPFRRPYEWATTLLGIFGPTLMTLFAPAPFRLAAAGTGLLWLAFSTGWGMRKTPDFARVLRALAPRLTAHP